MSLTNIMEDVDYDRKDFNVDYTVYRHPTWMTDGHTEYHLYRDTIGNLHSSKTSRGEELRSPRRLSALCIFRLVTDHKIIKEIRSRDIPSDLYPLMLSEAILQRELQAVELLVATWPTPILNVYEVIPLEDYIESGYLTSHIEGHPNMCLLDSFILGLLHQKSCSRLKFIDFTRFDKDRKLCRELCRLPLLWMKPEARKVEDIHDYIRPTIDISKDKVQRYLNRISVIYSDLDPDLLHENKIPEPITILMDCKLTMDDVPIGLSLQYLSPFRFICNKLWWESIPEVVLLTQNINKVVDPLIISHFELEDNQLSSSKSKQISFVRGLHTMPNLIALSLPCTLDVTVSPGLVIQVGKLLRTMKNLRKLNVSYCNLKSHLKILLEGIRHQMVYLNLRDCRLAECDLNFLLQWQPLKGLRELNLSRNNMKDYENHCISLLSKLEIVSCFSLSYCSLTVPSMHKIIAACLYSQTMKIFSFQSFTPPPWEDIHDLLHSCAKIQSLQKCILLPESYAFPGNNDHERQLTKSRVISRCYTYFRQKGRPDIEMD